MTESIKVVKPLLICRACLAQDTPMKDMYEWNMTDNFYRTTEVEIKRSDGLSTLICEECEVSLNDCLRFRTQCQRTELFLMDCTQKNYVLSENGETQAEEKMQKVEKLVVVNFKRKNNVVSKNRRTQTEEKMQKVEKSSVLVEFEETKLTYRFTPIDREKQNMVCPYNCEQEYNNTDTLLRHLRVHSLNVDNFTVHQKFYCPYKRCNFNIDSERSKFFSSRKFYLQHLNKVHERANYCDICNNYAGKDLSKHLKACCKDFACKLCDAIYKTDDRLSVHMLRKHPDMYEQYKTDRRLKRDRLKANGNTAKVNKAGNTEKGCKPKKRPAETDASAAKKPNIIVREHANENEIKKISELGSQDTTNKAFIDSYSEYIFDSSKRQNENVKKTKMAAPVQTDSSFSEFAIDQAKSTKILKQNDFSDYLNDSPKRQLSMAVSDEIDSYPFSCDSPRRSFATQTLSEKDKHVCIKNDINLSWQGKKATTETQTAFDDIFLKSDSNEEMFFPETTEPIEFGLSGSLKKHNFTQSPDLSMKETQTCCCLFDSPKTTGFSKLFDSINSSPMMNFTSTETQTQEFSKYSNVTSDVLLSFSSAETQTCADENDF